MDDRKLLLILAIIAEVVFAMFLLFVSALLLASERINLAQFVFRGILIAVAPFIGAAIGWYREEKSLGAAVKWSWMTLMFCFMILSVMTGINADRGVQEVEPPPARQQDQAPAQPGEITA